MEQEDDLLEDSVENVQNFVEGNAVNLSPNHYIIELPLNLEPQVENELNIDYATAAGELAADI